MLRLLGKKIINKQWVEGHESRKESAFIGYEEAQTLVVLIESDQYPPLIPVLDELRQDNKKISVILSDFRTHKEPVAYPDYVIRMTKSDIDRLTQLPKKEFVQKIVDFKPDALIDLTTTDNISLLALLTQIQAPQKMGYNQRNVRLYNFIIQSNAPETPFELAKNLLFYWRSIEIKKINL